MKEVLLTKSWIHETNITHFAGALDHFIAFLTINLPINIIFTLSVVYGVMEACLYYVFMHVCVCIYECMYIFCICMYLCMHVCMYVVMYTHIVCKYVCMY